MSMEIGPLSFSVIQVRRLDTAHGTPVVYCGRDGWRLGHVMPAALVTPSASPEFARSLLLRPKAP